MCVRACVHVCVHGVVLRVVDVTNSFSTMQWPHMRTNMYFIILHEGDVDCTELRGNTRCIALTLKKF